MTDPYLRALWAIRFIKKDEALTGTDGPKFSLRTLHRHFLNFLATRINQQPTSASADQPETLRDALFGKSKNAFSYSLFTRMFHPQFDWTARYRRLITEYCRLELGLEEFQVSKDLGQLTSGVHEFETRFDAKVKDKHSHNIQNYRFYQSLQGVWVLAMHASITIMEDPIDERRMRHAALVYGKIKKCSGRNNRHRDEEIEVQLIGNLTVWDGVAWLKDDIMYYELNERDEEETCFMTMRRPQTRRAHWPRHFGTTLSVARGVYDNPPYLIVASKCCAMKLTELTKCAIQEDDVDVALIKKHVCGYELEADYICKNISHTTANRESHAVELARNNGEPEEANRLLEALIAKEKYIDAKVIATNLDNSVDSQALPFALTFGH